MMYLFVILYGYIPILLFICLWNYDKSWQNMWTMKYGWPPMPNGNMFALGASEVIVSVYATFVSSWNLLSRHQTILTRRVNRVNSEHTYYKHKNNELQ